jgi:hypothetical protein
MADINGFFGWIRERESIRQKKEAGEPWPWTDDVILQTYKYCNVFREEDTVTKWVKKFIREPFADHENLWFLLAMSRQINWPATLQEIIYDSDGTLPDRWDAHAVEKVMLNRQDRGEKIFTGSYMLRGDIQGGLPGSIDYSRKPSYTCLKVLDPIFQAARYGGFDVHGKRPTEQLQSAPWYFGGVDCSLASYWNDGVSGVGATIQEVTSWLQQFHGWGWFLSYEVATDMRHTRYLRNASDIYTWANAGPGAIRGLNRIHGRWLDEKPKAEQTLEEMQALLDISQEELAGSHVAPLEMRDIEHSLCEMDKYQRVKLGQGRPRAKYRPPGVARKGD